MKKNTHKSQPTQERRVLGRRQTKSLTDEQLNAITGGGTTCSCNPDDCGVAR